MRLSETRLLGFDVGRFFDVKRIFAHPVSRASFLRIVGLLSGVLGSVVLARLGGPELKGVSSAYAAANAIAFMAINFDLAQVVLREARATQDLARVRQALVAGWLAYAVLGIAAVGLLALFDVSSEWLIVGAVAYLVGAQAGVGAIGISGPTIGAWGAIIQQGAMIAGVFVAHGLDALDNDSVRLIIVISYLAPLPFFLLAMRTPAAGRSPLNLSHLWRYVLAGLPWQLGRLLQMGLQKLDTLFVFSVLGAATAGVYSVGLSTAMLCTIVPAQFANQALHEATRTHGDVDTKRASVGALIGGAVPAAALAAVGGTLLTLLYGESFSSAYPVLLATLGGAIGYGVMQVQTNYIRILGRWWNLAIPAAFGLVAMIVGLWLLVGPLGAVGAGLAFSCGSIVAAATSVVAVRRLSASA